MSGMNGKLAGLVLATLLVACATSSEQSGASRELQAARATMDKANALPQVTELRRRLSGARALLVVSPGAGGVAMARVPDKAELSAPAFYGVTQVNAATGSGGTGFSRAPQKLEVVAAFISERSMDWLRSPTIPGQAGLRVAAAGATQAQRDLADVVVLDLKSPTATQVDFDVALLTIDAKANRAFYGAPLAPTEIFRRPAPAAAGPLQQALLSPPR
jgi:lipid-binding SYLF domain-containing protein